MTTAISVKGLSVTYQQTIALSSIDIDIPKGVKAALIGPNGAGKSTFLKAILELIPSQHQEIRLLDQPLKQAYTQLAYVPQTSEVNWHFPTTVYDVVMMGISSNRLGFQLIKQDKKEKVFKALEQMKLLDLKDRQISQLSGGQKQRVFMARAIAQDAQLYLLDEPLAGVDMVSEQLIMDQLQLFKEADKTSLTVHHDLNTLRAYYDYLIVINHHLVDHGPIDQVLNGPAIQKAYSDTPPLSQPMMFEGGQVYVH